MDAFLIELTELFHWTVRASAYAIVIIGVIVLAQMLLHRRLPAGWIYALWLILLARLPIIAAIVENKTQIKRRLTMITSFRPPRRIETLVAALLILDLLPANFSLR